jgi:hypothetical protein
LAAARATGRSRLMESGRLRRSKPDFCILLEVICLALFLQMRMVNLLE